MGRISFVGIRVSDLERATRFYRDAIGVPLQPDAERTHTEFSWRDPYFHFALFPPDAKWPGSTFVGFVVDDLDDAHRHAIEHGADLVHAPRDEPWGRTAALHDPDGNLVQLVQRDR